jgi:hypothetical protein
MRSAGDTMQQDVVHASTSTAPHMFYIKISLPKAIIVDHHPDK